MKDYEKLRNSLLAIKDECSHNSRSCLSCTFLLEGHICGITGIRRVGADYDYTNRPSNWIIPDIKLMSDPRKVAK